MARYDILGDLKFFCTILLACILFVSPIIAGVLLSKICDGCWESILLAFSPMIMTCIIVIIMLLPINSSVNDNNESSITIKIC